MRERLATLIEKLKSRRATVGAVAAMVIKAGGAFLTLAVFTLAALQSALRLAGVSSEYQNVAIGLLLIVSVIAPLLARQTRALVDRLHPGRPKQAQGPAPGGTVR